MDNLSKEAKCEHVVWAAYLMTSRALSKNNHMTAKLQQRWVRRLGDDFSACLGEDRGGEVQDKSVQNCQLSCIMLELSNPDDGTKELAQCVRNCDFQK